MILTGTEGWLQSSVASDSLVASSSSQAEGVQGLLRWGMTGGPSRGPGAPTPPSSAETWRPSRLLLLLWPAPADPALQLSESPGLPASGVDMIAFTD